MVVVLSKNILEMEKQIRFPLFRLSQKEEKPPILAASTVPISLRTPCGRYWPTLHHQRLVRLAAVTKEQAENGVEKMGVAMVYRARHMATLSKPGPIALI